LPEKVVSLTAFTEVDEIDILLTLTFEDREVHVAIENKIKATDHQVQLSTYDEKLSSRFGKKEVHKLFLTLAGEPPRSGNLWKPISYAILHDAIVSERLETPSVYVRDFCASLERLASVVSAARDTTTGLAAFAFGDLPYSGKNSAKFAGVLDYVERTRLEKAVQRTWMDVLAARFREVVPDRWSISISETRGQALVDVVTVLDLTPRVRIGLQLQGRSFKMFVAPEAYDDGETDLSRTAVAGALAVLQTGLGLETRVASRSRGKGFRSVSVIGVRGEQQFPTERSVDLWAATCTPWIERVVALVGTVQDWSGAAQQSMA
jgi:hypothetical protein